MKTTSKIIKKVKELTEEFESLEILQLCKELKNAVTMELTSEEINVMNIQMAVDFTNQYFEGKNKVNFTDYMLSARKAGVGHISILQIQKIYPEIIYCY